ncbi:MAG: hypothetical protein H8E91_04140 [Planctomycetes bacterium]|nr:hypothetical protein [Planctomycetota bacterium]
MIYCNETVLKTDLCQDDWVVSNETEKIETGIEAGCNTIYIGDETDSIRPTLFAPTVELALLFIQANEEV